MVLRNIESDRHLEWLPTMGAFRPSGLRVQTPTKRLLLKSKTVVNANKFNSNPSKFCLAKLLLPTQLISIPLINP